MYSLNSAKKALIGFKVYTDTKLWIQIKYYYLSACLFFKTSITKYSKIDKRQASMQYFQLQ